METSVIQKIILGAVFGGLIGFGVGWVYFTDRMPDFKNDSEVEEVVETGNDLNSTGNDTPEDSEQAITNDKLPSSYSEFPSLLKVASQTYGSSVVIEKAVFDSLGWVVVYEEVDGEPGNILGAGLFRKETGESGAVPLLRDTAEFKRYFVVLHQDDGDGEFDYSKDLVMRDAETGKLIMAYFFTY